MKALFGLAAEFTSYKLVTTQEEASTWSSSSHLHSKPHLKFWSQTTCSIGRTVNHPDTSLKSSPSQSINSTLRLLQHPHANCTVSSWLIWLLMTQKYKSDMLSPITLVTSLKVPFIQLELLPSRSSSTNGKLDPVPLSVTPTSSVSVLQMVTKESKSIC